MSDPVLIPFDVSDCPKTNAGNWPAWIRRFEIMADYKRSEDERKTSLVINGCQIDILYQTVKDDADTYKDIVAKLQKLFQPKKYIDVNVINFRRLSKGPSESITAFVTRLRTAAMGCDFNDLNVEIRYQLLMGCTSEQLKSRTIYDKLTLDQMIETGIGLEEGTSEIRNTINAMMSDQSSQYRRRNSLSFSRSSYSNKSSKRCFNCGGNFPPQLKHLYYK